MSGVKRKVLFLSVVLSAAALTGCRTALDNGYALSQFDISSAYQHEDGLKAAGFASSLCVPETDGQLNTDGVSADSFALFDLTDHRIVAQKGIFEKVYPASTTKILTCLIALEEGNLDDVVTVPDESAITVSGSSMADLKPGDQLTLRDLLYGLMVPSGNDAAVAIAYHIAGGVPQFAALMNERAEALGATDSHFANPHGLPDEEHYTTVYDMYLIFNEAMKDERFLEIASKPSYTASITDASGAVREATWTNGNAFLSGKYSLPEGVTLSAGKTGHTSAAGFCLVMGEKDASGKQYASIVMKAPSYEELYQSMQNLIGKKDS